MNVVIKSDIDEKLNEYFSNWSEKKEQFFTIVGNELTNAIVLKKLSGNPVRRRTGNLANSIGYNLINDGVEVGSYGVRYAEYLEKSKRFERYRWLKPAYQENIRNIIIKAVGVLR